MQARGLAGLGIEVVVRRVQLVLRALSPLTALYHGFALHPDDAQDPDVFRIDLSRFGMGTVRVVFSRDAGGRTRGLHTDFFPLALWKDRSSTPSRMWLTGALWALAVAGTATAVRRPQHRPSQGGAS